MRLLLDSHVFLWWTGTPERLPAAVHGALEDPQNELFLSAASAWEIRIKLALERLRLSRPFRELVEREISENGLRLLPVTFAHTEGLATLNPLHRDPFDRMLIAQTLIEEMTLVSGDRWIGQYPDVTVLWT